jgi:hypothetical protein
MRTVLAAKAEAFRAGEAADRNAATAAAEREGLAAKAIAAAGPKAAGSQAALRSAATYEVRMDRTTGLESGWNAAERREPMRETNWTTGLVGRCFHVPRSRHDGVFEVQNQGVVRAKVQEDIYLVQFFDFIMSEPTNLKLFKIEQMLAWQFYENDEHMRFWHEHRYIALAAREDGIADDGVAGDHARAE